MLIRHPDQVEPQPMRMAGAAGVTMRLMVGRDDGAPNFALRLFEVAPGGHTPEHSHNYEHEVLILSGQGEVVDGAKTNLRLIGPGQVLFIPANQMHQFRNPGPEPLKFACLVPTRFDCGSGTTETTLGS